MTAHVAWARGGEADVVSIDAHAHAQTIVLRSTVPSPPGSRIEGTLRGEPPAVLRVKVHASRRQPDGTFLLEGRLLDMPRDTRARVVALMSGASV
ncbi:MAG TPA: hypothetical protein VIY73_15685 [Polyangiaceae bacterium]